MSIDAIAARLGRLALPPRLAAARDPAALLKSWHGQGPLVRDPVAGLFSLDLLSHHEVGYIAAIANAERNAARRQAPEAFRQPPDSEPLSQTEVDAAFEGRALDTYSSIRRAAAILDAAGGGPLPLDEVNRRLQALSRWGRIDERMVKAWRSGLMRAEPNGLLRLDPTSPDVAGMRRDIRRMALPALRQGAEAARFSASLVRREAERAAEEHAQAEEARRARRALVHVVLVDGAPHAAAADTVRPAHSYRADNRSCRLKVTLDGIEPPIWRLLHVAADLTLAKLHGLPRPHSAGRTATSTSSRSATSALASRTTWRT